MWAMASGPKEQTIHKHLAAIGQKNQCKKKKAPAEKLAAWAKRPENYEDADYIWDMIENGQMGHQQSAVGGTLGAEKPAGNF